MRTLVVLLMVSLFPGAAEAVADVGHALVNGHDPHGHLASVTDHDHDHQHVATVDTGHIDAGEDEPPAHEEHHCSALFHLCGCHVPAPTTTTSWMVMASTAWAELPDPPIAIVSDLGLRPADGAAAAALRPPIV